jgi:hypothetical protein
MSNQTWRPSKVSVIYFAVHKLETTIKGKGKVNPTTGHEAPKEEQMYSSTLSLTSAL